MQKCLKNPLAFVFRVRIFFATLNFSDDRCHDDFDNFLGDVKRDLFRNIAAATSDPAVTSVPAPIM